MANPKRIDLGQRSGVSIEYVKSRDVIFISGWYDSFVGIEGGVLSRAEFEERLGIPATPPRAPAGGEGDDNN